MVVHNVYNSPNFMRTHSHTHSERVQTRAWSQRAILAAMLAGRTSEGVTSVGWYVSVGKGGMFIGGGTSVSEGFVFVCSVVCVQPQGSKRERERERDRKTETERDTKVFFSSNCAVCEWNIFSSEPEIFDFHQISVTTWEFLLRIDHEKRSRCWGNSCGALYLPDYSLSDLRTNKDKWPFLFVFSWKNFHQNSLVWGFFLGVDLCLFLNPIRKVVCFSKALATPSASR